jgi:competence ComEA-like helix-hairpin-helix protein
VGVQILKKYGKCIVIFSISAIVTALILFLILYKPPIENASINELKDIDGIGPMKAAMIEKYYDQCPDASIESVEDIDGIGEKTVEKLKEKYR